jgi:hypothetical protein
VTPPNYSNNLNNSGAIKAVAAVGHDASGEKLKRESPSKLLPRNKTGCTQRGRAHFNHVPLAGWVNESVERVKLLTKLGAPAYCELRSQPVGLRSSASEVCLLECAGEKASESALLIRSRI